MRLGGAGGFGGLGDLQRLAKQAQQMQDDAAKLQNELGDMRITVSAGGGMVSATVNGHGHLMALKIRPAAADPEDVEMLEDLIVTASKEATLKAQATQEERMKTITGGLDGLKLPPGLF